MKIKTQNDIRKKSKWHHYLTSVGIISLMLIFALGNSFASEPPITMDTTGDFAVGNTAQITIKIDGTNEGAGLLGAETDISFDKNLIEVESVVFEPCPFDNCLDIDIPEGVKLMAISSWTGKKVAAEEVFATINVNFIAEGEAIISITKCDVIDETGGVKKGRMFRRKCKHLHYTSSSS